MKRKPWKEESIYVTCLPSRARTDPIASSDLLQPRNCMYTMYVRSMYYVLVFRVPPVEAMTNYLICSI